MTCERCGKDTYPLSFCPTKVSQVTNRIKDGEWVCKNCFTPEEKKFVLKQEMLRRIQSAPQLTIYDTDVEWAWQKLADWRCPKNRDPTVYCRGYDCFGDTYWSCREYLQAHLTVYYVMMGKTKVVNLNRPWEAPV